MEILQTTDNPVDSTTTTTASINQQPTECGINNGIIESPGNPSVFEPGQYIQLSMSDYILQILRNGTVNGMKDDKSRYSK